MSPDEIYRGLAQRVLDEEVIAKMFYWNKMKMSPETKPENCDYFCRLALYCELVHPEQFEFNNCIGQPNYDFVNNPYEAFMNIMTSEWVKDVREPNNIQ
jgi:hypothetical protein